MFFVFVSIFVTLAVIINSYKHIDNADVVQKDVMKACAFAVFSLACLSLRIWYFALPDQGMVTVEYLGYRKYLLWGFLFFMGYIARAIIYGSVFLFRKKK
ncbi:MAG: hypothetical protein P8P98_02695 [Emcibacteraceae bacterium]|nr:hypothetical protein [Emcibacteraceae bacterium]MDG1994944.1 hypothetical protein [Emcibacteraceae bacterium]